jgi:hypothetical protein
MGIFCETIIVKSQLVNLFSGEFLPFGATVRRRRRSSGGGVAFYASRIREETRPWPKYESQGAVESEDQLLFFAGGNKKAASAATTEGRKLRSLQARPPPLSGFWSASLA